MIYGGNLGGLAAWLWMGGALMLVAGLVLIGAWAVGSSGRPREDEALELLRARFARGELDTDSFEKAHRVLRDTGPTGGRRPTQAIVGGILVAVALVAALIAAALAPTGAPARAGALVPGGAGLQRPGPVGPPQGDGAGPGPSVPVGPTVRIAATRIQPATLTVTVGQTVRWINDDTVAHRLTAVDRSWDSGSVPPGGSYERRFDTPGKYAYSLADQPRLTGTISVTR